MRTFILPYKTGRAVPRELRNRMGWKRIKLIDSKYRAKPGDVIINWGYSRDFYYEKYLINNTVSVGLAVFKDYCLEELTNSGIKTVEWTIDPYVACDWIDEGSEVYCRTLLNGHSGQGIVIAKTKEELVPAPLYTKGIGKCREYRVHVIDGEVVLIAQKKRRNGGDADGAIKNHHSGWVYSTIDIYPLSDDAIRGAIKAINCLGLDFGAVDIATRGDNHFVLEVNTAPGLHGKTLDVYATKLDELVQRRRN